MINNGKTTNRKRKQKENIYSEFKIAQTMWFVTSVYFGFMITEVTKSGLLPAIVESHMDFPRIVLSILTLVVYFVTAAESYLWLNPDNEKAISSSSALFKGAFLLVFLVAVIVHVFLYYPLISMVETQDVSFWTKSLSVLIFVYMLYNVIWGLMRYLIERDVISDYGDCPSWFQILIYILLYSSFSLIFLIISLVCDIWTLKTSITITTIFFLIYFFLYFYIWWDNWHKNALKIKSNINY
ncbi:hypothetical protein [Vibrio penaeicida]|uniref:hypothetical protein n=1 Tax=Vibrio penaeicida TaxID=104609 RepID=UPI000CE9EE6E|nr:hypothetical protein [Vibrio penaeicida]